MATKLPSTWRPTKSSTIKNADRRPTGMRIGKRRMLGPDAVEEIIKILTQIKKRSKKLKIDRSCAPIPPDIVDLSNQRQIFLKVDTSQMSVQIRISKQAQA